MGQIAFTGQRPAKYLLTYRSVGGAVEVIFNMRSGLVPPRIQLFNGEVGVHIPAFDRPAPAHTPRIGDRVFVKMTNARVWSFAKLAVQLKQGGDPTLRSTEARAQAVLTTYETLRQVAQMGVPDLLPVTEEMLERFQARVVPARLTRAS